MSEFVIFLHPVDPGAKRPLAVTRAHCAHLDCLDADGRLIAAGPFVDEKEGGLVIGRFVDLAAAERFARADPLVLGGYSRPQVRAWAWSHAVNGHLGIRDSSPGCHPQFLESLHLRATTRQFSMRAMEAEQVRGLLAAALAAPSEFNLQPWRPVVCHSSADRRRLQSCCLNQSQVGDAALAVICTVDPQVFIDEAPRGADEMIASGQRALADRDAVIAFIRSCYADPHHGGLRNGVIFGHQLLLAGLSQGLAGFWLGGFAEDALRQEFDLPERAVIAGVVGLGWPLVQYQPMPRQAMARVVGWGRWPGPACYSGDGPTSWAK